MSYCEPFISRHLEFLKDNFLCEEMGDYVAITTPYVYDDFDLIQVFLKEDASGNLLVTDLGEALRHVVVMTGKDIFDSQEDTIRRIANKHELILTDDGEMLALSSHAESGWAIFRVAMAAKEVSDLCHTARAQKEVQFGSRVRSFFETKRIPYNRNHPVKGSMDIEHSVDFYVPTGNGKLIQIIGQQGRKQKVYETYTIFNDLMESKDPRTKLVIMERKLPPKLMSYVRNKSDRLLFWDAPEEISEALAI